MLFQEHEKRYLQTFLTQEKALLNAQKASEKSYSQLLETYQAGHVDIIKRVDSLAEQMTLNKGMDTGYKYLVGWLFAGITLLVSIGMFLIEIQTAKDSKSSLENKEINIETMTELLKLKNFIEKTHPKQ